MSREQSEKLTKRKRNFETNLIFRLYRQGGFRADFNI